jgi:hypothetical protein
MKQITKIIPILLFALSCKAQSPIKNITEDNGARIEGIYFKDINNYLDPFVGTYLYTNGTTSLKIVFEKKVMSYDGHEYEDMLIGEYQYIENGVEKTNTLDELNAAYENQNNHSFSGNMIRQYGGPRCTGCVPNEIRIVGGFVEKSTQNSAFPVILTKIMVGNQVAIKLNIGWEMRTYVVGEETLLPPSFPGGPYVLLKQ